jgi:hypothetical protein
MATSLEVSHQLSEGLESVMRLVDEVQLAYNYESQSILAQAASAPKTTERSKETVTHRLRKLHEIVTRSHDLLVSLKDTAARIHTIAEKAMLAGLAADAQSYFMPVNSGMVAHVADAQTFFGERLADPCDPSNLGPGRVQAYRLANV